MVSGRNLGDVSYLCIEKTCFICTYLESLSGEGLHRILRDSLQACNRFSNSRL